MKISVISFTKNGEALSRRLKRQLEENRIADVNLFRQVELDRWVGEQFAAGRPIVFIGACGIAVRAVAPHVKSKLTDSPVLVMDEAARFVIPLLSGHLGGANKLAEQIAACMGAAPVITTATDLNGCFAVDLFAKENALRILKTEGIAAVSGKLLSGETITISAQGLDPDKASLPEGLVPGPYPPDESVDLVISTEEEALQKAVCPLQPKQYAVGLGCKQGKAASDLEAFCKAQLAKRNLTFEDLFAFASIDAKAEETGLCQLAEKNRIPLVTFSAEELKQAEGTFHGSAFVAEQMGVDNVCERAALCACGGSGQLILEKRAENGMTFAVAKRPWSADQLIWESGDRK